MLVNALALVLMSHADGGTRLMADLDEDGELEHIEAVLNAKNRVVLRVKEAGMKGKAATAEFVLPALADVEGPLTAFSLSWSNASQSGVPLLVLAVPRRETCASASRTFYFTYRSAKPRQRGELAKAFVLTSGSDAPVFSEETVRMQPESKSVVITRVEGEHLEAGGQLADTTETTLTWNGTAFKPTASRKWHSEPQKNQ